MVLTRKTAGIATTLLLAVALLPMPALAQDYSWGDRDGSREFPLAIDANVAAPVPTVIKVEVPSSSSVVNIRVDTSVIDGRFLGFTAGECHIKNLPESTVPISAAITKVVDGPDGKAKALKVLDVSLSADKTVHLKEGVNQNDVVVERLDPGVAATIAVGVEDGCKGRPIPEGNYAASATIKVSAV